MKKKNTLSEKIRGKKKSEEIEKNMKALPRNYFEELKKGIKKEKKAVEEMKALLLDLEKLKEIEDRKMAFSQIVELKKSIKETNEGLLGILKGVGIPKQLPKQKAAIKLTPSTETTAATKTPSLKNYPKLKKIELLELEKETIKRLRKKEKKIKKIKLKKPSKYVQFSNRLFSEFSISLINQGMFKGLKRDLIKANMQFLSKSYVSVMFLTTIISSIISLFALVFFLFFSIGPELPIITLAKNGIGERLLSFFWIIFVIPCLTFLSMYVYPSLEKNAISNKIEQELPFATIHMSAISGSMVEPSKIFSIIISTKEYPSLEKELFKLLNEINIFGHDLVTGLRNIAFSTPSKKLAELLNGMATTITSGGDLPEFFDKRAQTLLFEYRLEREKYTKSAETFMDIYISVVIAAPMILMLLLMMMKISGLGISLPTSLITLMMILGVSVVNIIFLTFLHLKQPNG